MVLQLYVTERSLDTACSNPSLFSFNEYESKFNDFAFLKK